jgi:alanine dehydrogenase
MVTSVGQRVAPVLLLDRQMVTELLTLKGCIPAVEAAFAAHAQGAALEPGLLHVASKGGEFHIKVGGLQGEHTYFAAKINGGFFNNRAAFGLPNIIGLIVLCDGIRGIPLAVMESGLVTRLRTGAATAVAARYLARPDSRTVTICGAGIQGEIQLRALKEVLPIEHAFIWSRSGAPELAAQLRSALGIDAQAVSDLGQAARGSDVIITCTPAKGWFLGREHVSPGTFIAAVGSDSPDKQEIEPALLAESSVVPDLLNQAAHVGDLHHAIAAGLMQPGQIRGELGAVIAGLAPRRTDDDEIIIFDSTGTALQDAAAAATVYEQALRLGRGQSFAFWD